MGLSGADVRLDDKATFQQIPHEPVADQVAAKKVSDFCNVWVRVRVSKFL